MPVRKYQTYLKPKDEAMFNIWLQQNQIPFRDAPDADYDMRGYFQALRNGDERAVQAGNGHFPDVWKTPFHKTFSDESIYADENAPSWTGDDAAGWRLVSKQGKVLATEGMPGVPMPIIPVK